MSQSMMSVTSLNTKIKSLLEATFMHIEVEGEVSSVTYHTSGHVYFSIKDATSALKCVMWRSTTAKQKFRIEQGMHIVVQGSVSVYTPRGEYQFQVNRVEPYGEGALSIAFEQLKKRLEAKGYFDRSRKKTLPRIPQRIALVTAQDSAALHDMLKIAENRWPLVEIVVIDTLVQGDEAAEQIALALRYADTLGVDLVITGRGGGSREDLWAFNEETVADAIYTMSVPVISAVGHEIDTLISDFVADVRAPTPSGAMEIVLPDQNEILQQLEERQVQMRGGIAQIIQAKERETQHAMERLRAFSPLQRLEMLRERFADIHVQLTRQITHRLEQYEAQIVPLAESLSRNIRFVIDKKVSQTEAIHTRLLSLDPHKQTKESWAQIVKNGQKVSLAAIDAGDEFDLMNAEVKVRVRSLGKTSL